MAILLVWGLGVAIILGLTGSCRNPDHYKRSADKEVYDILTGKWKDDFGQQVNYRVSEQTPNDVDIARMIPPSGVINLAQAAAIVAYEFNLFFQPQEEQTEKKKSQTPEIEPLLARIDQTLTGLNLETRLSIDRLMLRIRKIAARADLDREDINMLHGLLREIQKLGVKS